MNKWYSNPIVLSTNNESTSGVAVTFNFDASTPIASGAYVAITFPSDFNLSSVANVVNTNTVEWTNTSVTSTNNSKTVSNVTNPTGAKGYGPFKIVTRHSQNGQIIDANYVFGSVGIASAKGTISTVTVAYASGSVGTVNTPAQSVEFSFTIAKDLWKHDMFAITFDNRFTVASGTTCTSIVGSGNINYYNNTVHDATTTDTTAGHALDCVESAQTQSNAATPTVAPTYNAQTVYIYGNANDIDVESTAATGNTQPAHNDAKSVKLRISGVKNPYAVLTGYSWTVQTLRFQTHTIIEEGTGSGGLVTVAGPIASGTIASTWASSASDIPKTGTTFFMDASITISNQVFDGDTAEINFDDNVGASFPTSGGEASAGTCYMIAATARASGAWTTCAAATKKVTVSNIANSQSNTEFKFRVLATITQASGTASTISSAITKNGSTTIDSTNTALASLTRSTTIEDESAAGTVTWGINTLLDQAATPWAGAGAKATETDSGVNGFQLVFPSTKAFGNDSSILVRLPLSASHDSYKFGIPTTGYKMTIQCADVIGDSCDATAQGASTSGGSGGAGTAPQEVNGSGLNISGSINPSSSATSLGDISITFATPTETNVIPTAGHFVCIAIGQATSPGTVAGMSANPQVSSNISTAYEIWIKTSNVGTGTEIQTRVLQPTVAARAVATETILPLSCQDAINGQVFTVVSTASETNIPSADYYFEIEFATNSGTTTEQPSMLGSGLNEGDEYPTNVTVPASGTVYISTYGVTNKTYLRVKSAGTTFGTNVNIANFILSLPEDNDSTAYDAWAATPKLSVFTFASVADTRVKNEIYHSTASTVNGGADPTGKGMLQFAPGTGQANIDNATSIGNYALLIELNATTASAQNDSLTLVLPKGSQVASSAKILYVTGEDDFIPTPWAYLSSTNFNYNYPALVIGIGATAVSGNKIQGAGGSAGNTVTLSGITTRDARYTGTTPSTRDITMGQGSKGTAAACHSNKQAYDWSLTGKLNAATKVMTTRSISPTSVTERGKEVMYTDITIGFTPNVDIPNNGEIVLALDSTWAFSASTVCTTSGLSANSATPPVGPTWVNPTSNQGLTINQFGKITSGTGITIECTYVLSTTSTSTIDLVSTLVIYDGTGGDEINTWGTTASSVQVTVTAKATTPTNGSSLDWVTSFIPNNASAGTADAHLKFKVDMPLPKGTTVTIDFPANLANVHSSGHINNSCWSTVRYQSCQINSGNLQIVTDENVSSSSEIELYVNKGFTLPTVVTASTDVFKVIATYGGLTIVSDAATIVASKQFTATTAIAGTITVPSVTMSNNNAGEFADYTFKFKASTGYTVGDKIVIYFPNAFDPFVGMAGTWLDNESSTYYLECSSTALGLSWCSVDKWKVTIMGSSAVAAENEIDITLNHVANPAEGTTSEKLMVAVVNASGVYQAQDTAFGTNGVTTVKPPAKNITFKSVMSSNHYLFSTGSTYTFEFYLNDAGIESDESISVMFPMQYDLHLQNGSDTYTCDTSLVDSKGATEVWNTDASCSSSGNWVMLDAVAYTNETADRFTWEIQGVSNPEMGFARTAGTNWDFDVTDTTVFGSMGVWSNNFELYTFDVSDKGYSGKSYGNLNAAYLGFNYKYDQITINSGNTIQVWAGSYTGDIAITAEGGKMSSASVTLSPSANKRSRNHKDNSIAFQSPEHNFVFFSEVNSINFRVGADISLSKGIYYIDWSITEVSHGTSNTADAKYHHPRKTKVEVIANTTGKYSFSVQQTDGNVYAGTNSADIRVSTTNAPFSDVTLSLALSTGANEKVIFEPASLLFNADHTTRYFQIKIADDIDLTTATNPYSIVFTAAGTDKNVFSAPGNLQFNINAKPTDTTAGAISSFGVGTCGLTSCTMTPTVTKVGTMWWSIEAQKNRYASTDYADATCPSRDTIMKYAVRPNVDEANYTADQKANADKTTDDYAATETNPAEGETWADFQYRIYKEHLADSYYGALNISDTANSQQINATWLFSATKYQICGYADNVYGQTSAGNVAYFETNAQDTSEAWEVSATGTSTTGTSKEVIRDLVSYRMGVPVERNIDMQVVHTAPTTRRLQGSTDHVYKWTGVLAASRGVGSPTTATIASLSTEDSASLTTDIKTKLGSNFTVAPYSHTTYSAAQATVNWTTSPAIKSVTDTAVTISFKSDNANGEIACVVLDGKTQSEYKADNDFKPSAEQVYLGLDANNQAAKSAKKIDAATSGTAAEEITLDGLSPQEKYSAFCTATNGALVWPSYVSYTSYDSYSPLDVNTTGEKEDDDSDDDSALLVSSNIVAICTMIAALIFN